MAKINLAFPSITLFIIVWVGKAGTSGMSKRITRSATGRPSSRRPATDNWAAQTFCSVAQPEDPRSLHTRAGSPQPDNEIRAQASADWGDVGGKTQSNRRKSRSAGEGSSDFRVAGAGGESSEPTPRLHLEHAVTRQERRISVSV